MGPALKDFRLQEAARVIRLAGIGPPSLTTNATFEWFMYRCQEGFEGKEEGFEGILADFGLQNKTNKATMIDDGVWVVCVCMCMWHVTCGRLMFRNCCTFRNLSPFS